MRTLIAAPQSSAYHFKGTGVANGTPSVVDGALMAKIPFVLSIHL